jgi:SAM-dependent methyltransferase
MAQKPMNGETRTIEQLRTHYEIEKDLASRLKNASRQDRRDLYSSLYDEMYQRVPLHPQLTQKSSLQQMQRAVAGKIQLIKPFLGKDITFLEVGPGDCALSFEVAKYVKQVYAVDVSDEITKNIDQPPNFDLVLSDGSSIPLPPNCVNVAYSNQLMEHLHPEDAFEQLESIYHALAPGGVYICITPNRLSGPHDISKYFDEVATGFHLKEYTTLELRSLLQQVGFSQVKVYIGAAGKYLNIPAFLATWCEQLLNKLPFAVRKPIGRSLLLRLLLGIRLIAMK